MKLTHRPIPRGAERAQPLRRDLPRFTLFLAVCAASIVTGCPRGSGQQESRTLPETTSSSPSAEADLRAAREAAERGDVAAAERLFEQFLLDHASDPLAPRARLGLGRALLARGAVEVAIERFEAVARDEDPRIAESGRFYRGVALHLVGRSEDALRDLLPLVGRTVDPEETTLLLQTVAAAAGRTGDLVAALGALDRLAARTGLDEAQREAALAETRALVSRAEAAAIERAYGELARDGVAWREVAQRAMRIAFDAGDMARVAAIVAELRARRVAMSEDLAQLALRAERTVSADPRVIGAIVQLTAETREPRTPPSPTEVRHAAGLDAMRGLTLASSEPRGAPPNQDAPQLVFRDHRGDPERAAQAVEELVSVHRAVAIIGPIDTASARAAARRAQELGVPLIALVPDTSLTSTGEMVFRLLPGPREEAASLVAAARSRGATRFVILRPDDAAGQAHGRAFRDAVDAAGGTLTAEETYPPGATTYGPIVRRLATHEFDAIYVPDQGRILALIAPALAAAGVWSAPPGQRPAAGGRGVQLLAPSIAASPAALRPSARYLQGALFASTFDAPTATGSARSFVEQFTQRFEAAPAFFAASAFDAFQLVRTGVQAGNSTRAALAAWLRSAGRIETVASSGGTSAERSPAAGSRLLELRGEAMVAVPPAANAVGAR